MVHLYHPYPALPDDPPSPPPQGAKEREKSKVTTDGTIVALLPSLAPIVDVAAGQWGAGELPEGQRMRREWWVGDDDEMEATAGGKEEVEDGEIPESLAEGSAKGKGKERAVDRDGDGGDEVPSLTKAHYAPRVVALARRMAARRGVKLCVDPRARKELETTQTQTRTTTTTAAQPQIDMTPRSPPLTPVSYPAASPSINTHQPTPETREATPSSFSDTTAAHLPLGKGIRGRARGRGTGRWAGHWQAKAAAAANREARAAQVVARGGVAGSSAGQGQGEERDEGPEAERRRRREVGVALGSSSWW